jgi:heme/copper-type cytochrome/quinol oxidase subunit 2
MSGDFPKGFAVAAIIVVLLAVAVLGAIVGYNLKPLTTVDGKTSSETAYITLVVQGSFALGPDGKLHDAFVPCNFTVYANQLVYLTVVNYDTSEHSFTSPTLNVNFAILPSNTTGIPAVSNFQFTEANAGVYRWYCSYPCDTGAGGWAMTTGSDGQPGQIGFMGGFVTVLPG